MPFHSIIIQKFFNGFLKCFYIVDFQSIIGRLLIIVEVNPVILPFIGELFCAPPQCIPFWREVQPRQIGSEIVH